MKRLIGCPQSVGKILLVSLLQMVCLEADNFDSKLASLRFVANTIDRILLKRRQSVFPPFVGFICSVTVVFCCCLFTYSWSLYSLCLYLTVRFAFAVPLLALNLKSTFLLLRSFVCKSFPARISSHLLNPLLLSLLVIYRP